MFARFPEKPTPEEKEALRSYVHLFQRLYPWYATCPYRDGVVAAEVRHVRLTEFAAENALSTLEKC